MSPHFQDSELMCFIRFIPSPSFFWFQVFSGHLWAFPPPTFSRSYDAFGSSPNCWMTWLKFEAPTCWTPRLFQDLQPSWQTPRSHGSEGTMCPIRHGLICFSLLGPIHADQVVLWSGQNPESNPSKKTQEEIESLDLTGMYTPNSPYRKNAGHHAGSTVGTHRLLVGHVHGTLNTGLEGEARKVGNHFLDSRMVIYHIFHHISHNMNPRLTILRLNDQSRDFKGLEGISMENVRWN